MLSKNENLKVLNMRRNRNGGNNSTKSGGKSNSGGGSNNGHGTWKSKIDMIEKKVRNHKRKLSVLNTGDNPGSDNEESDNEEKEYGNGKSSDLTRQGKSKRSKKA